MAHMALFDSFGVCGVQTPTQTLPGQDEQLHFREGLVTCAH